MRIFYKIFCYSAFLYFAFCLAPVQSAPLAAAVADDGYAGKVLQKILNTGKLKFGQKMDLRLSLDDQGHLLECRSSKGDATAACAAAKAASPFGTPPYGVPTYVTIALWTGQLPTAKAQETAKNNQIEKEQITTPELKSTSAWLNKTRRELRNAMYIPAQTKPGTYHVTAKIKFDSAGKIIESSIIKSSGDKTLDKYCLQGINRAGKVPTPPAGSPDTADITFTLIRR